MYATADRTHDATWLLQGELKLNDAILRGQRAKKRKTSVASRNTSTMLTCAATPNEDLRAAEEVMRRVAARRGISDADLAQVLEALGLVEPPSEPKPTPKPARPLTGTCAQCGRLVHLRRDGMAIAHTWSKHAPPGTPHCPGTHMQPRSEATP